LTAYFRAGHFVGYSYRGTNYATDAGLGIGDRIANAQGDYGSRLQYGAVNGGRWWLAGSARGLAGYLTGPSGVRNHLVGPRSRIASISAGSTGCPAAPEA
jgi:hypothetical protein